MGDGCVWGSLQAARDLGTDVGHQSMPVAARLVLAHGQCARRACMHEELTQVPAFHEWRHRKDQPIARVCLHHLGDVGIGKRCAAPGGLQEWLADGVCSFRSLEPQHLHGKAAIKSSQALDSCAVGFEAAFATELLGTLVAAQLLQARRISRCQGFGDGRHQHKYRWGKRARWTRVSRRCSGMGTGPIRTTLYRTIGASRGATAHAAGHH
jgi:hypothetical protein